MEFSDNLKKSNILLKPKSTSRWDLLSEMVDLAVKNREIDSCDCDELTKSLVEREKSMSTGIGNGVAIPHCTTTRVQDIVYIVAIVPQGIDFDSIDNQPVKIVILLLVPKSKLTQHIKTLANIAKLMSNETLRNTLIALKNPESVIKTIKDFENIKKQ